MWWYRQLSFEVLFYKILRINCSIDYEYGSQFSQAEETTSKISVPGYCPFKANTAFK